MAIYAPDTLTWHIASAEEDKHNQNLADRRASVVLLLLLAVVVLPVALGYAAIRSLVN